MSGGSMAINGEVAHASSFDFVFSTHHTYVYKVAHTLLGNSQDAEDVTQEVFLRVYKALPTYDPGRANMRTWLTKLTVNACKTHRRRNFLHYLWRSPHREDGTDPALEAIDLSDFGAPEDEVLQRELRNTVKSVLARLRPEHRTVIVLHYYLDLSCPEIASILDCPEGTVYSRLHYARRLVESHLKHHTPR